MPNAGGWCSRPSRHLEKFIDAYKTSRSGSATNFKVSKSESQLIMANGSGRVLYLIVVFFWRSIKDRTQLL